MRVALLASSAQAGNAIGNAVAAQLAFFLERGEARVFLSSTARLHPALEGHAQAVAAATPSGPVWDFLGESDLVLVHYAEYFDLLHFLPLLASGPLTPNPSPPRGRGDARRLAGKKPRILFEYHGVTPPEFFRGAQRERQARARSQRGLAWCTDAALVHSRFMKEELLGGTRFPAEAVHTLDFPVPERFSPGATIRKATDARRLLFVGRCAANKRIPVLIEALARLDADASLPRVQVLIAGDPCDVYQEEIARCNNLAESLSIAEQIQWLGAIRDEELAAAYKSADALVVPSLHEGFCIPILEAMACGLPVIAARAAALPETVGDAGLTFAPDDAEDLARQVRRVLFPSPATLAASPTKRRMAIACFRWGDQVVGGAETSLRRMAEALCERGWQIEVFTTCTQSENAWRNELAPGTFEESGFTVHRFPIDAHDREKHLRSLVNVLQAPNGTHAAEYLRHSIHSSALIEALRGRIGEYAAIITGPYLFGLTHDVACAFPEKTLVVPCFHDEPLAHLSVWPATYERAGGILYHSPEEQAFAQTVLGLNHPNAVEIGTYLPTTSPALPCMSTFNRDPKRSAGIAASANRISCTSGIPSALPSGSRLNEEQGGARRKKYLVYCGRYSAEKDLPRLLDYAARYEASRPGRFQFAFMGQGEVRIPQTAWTQDLGHVDEATKRTLLANAAALVQLSRNESLSLVVLEAWREGTPVIVDRRSLVLAGQIERSGGGRSIVDFGTFARALDDLHARPAHWKDLGKKGQTYVAARYGCPERFAQTLEQAIANLQRPIRELMREHGLGRAERSRTHAWRVCFGRILEKVLQAAPRGAGPRLVVLPQRDEVSARLGTRTQLIPLRVENQGDMAATADGPAQSVVCHRLIASDCSVVCEDRTKLAGLLLPNQVQPLAAPIRVPDMEGEYRVEFWTESTNLSSGKGEGESTFQYARVRLLVGHESDHGCTGPMQEIVRAALVQIERLRQLPDDYVDVTEGRFARFKRWLKQKLLGNFKRGYVDVLSRQQSEVNQQLFTAVQQLAECCATLDHAVQTLQQKLDESVHTSPTR
ncbi:MAG: glycosyltransferase [Gemmataceae bacterium]|nr:glycosyltransferase [Gemmataceae bacterium]MCI0739183.1 glycosyltransferase [Gemmataceae bacterium]